MNTDNDSVTIPMTKKDKDGNVMEYRVTPLVFNDERLKLLSKTMGRQLQAKMLKLYKRTKDAEARTPAIEMASFLAVFSFEQLLRWYGALTEVTGNPKTVSMNTFHVFGETFRHLVEQLEAHSRAEVEALNPEVVEPVTEDSESSAVSDTPTQGNDYEPE